MNIDLLVPRFPPAHWNFSFAMDVEGSAYSHPPLGAATLAAYTPDGVPVRIHDENVEDVDLRSLGDTVGISAMYIQRARAFQLARELRALGKRVLIGGGLTHALPERCAREADVVFHGEAELTWPAFVEDLLAGRVRPAYRPSTRFDMSRSRMPRFDLLKMNQYSTASIQTSRGCPFRCDYCDVPQIDGPVPRTKTVEAVMAEVEELWAMGLRSFFFVDDHFLGNRRYATQLLREITRFVERERYKPIFYCQATLNVARDEEMLETLYRANFRRLFIGIESDDATALEGVNKSHNTRMPIADAVRTIQSWNITVWAALLVGFDEDGPSVFDRYRRFVDETKIGMVIPGLLQAVPGTAYHQRLRGDDRLIPLRNGYVGGQAGSLDSLLVTNVRPKQMSLRQLLDGYRSFARALYEYDAFADRLLGFVDLGLRPELGRPDVGDVWEARGVLARAVRHYCDPRHPERVRFFARVLAGLARRGFRRADETIFHLVLYKHLREFYFRTANADVAVAEDLLEAERSLSGGVPA